MSSQNNKNTVGNQSRLSSADDNLADNLKNLNVNANVFVPGKNVFASEFVPTPTVTSTVSKVAGL